MSARQNFMRFGPAFPVVPLGDFSRMPLTDQEWADAWRLCGPSAEQNMRGGYQRRPLELWQVIASAYLEGLQHGAAVAQRDGERTESQCQIESPSPIVTDGE